MILINLLFLSNLTFKIKFNNINNIIHMFINSIQTNVVIAEYFAPIQVIEQLNLFINFLIPYKCCLYLLF